LRWGGKRDRDVDGDRDGNRDGIRGRGGGRLVGFIAEHDAPKDVVGDIILDPAPGQVIPLLTAEACLGRGSSRVGIHLGGPSRLGHVAGLGFGGRTTDTTLIQGHWAMAMDAGGHASLMAFS